MRLPLVLALAGLGIAALMLFAQVQSPVPPQSPEVVRWITSNAIPLKTVEAGHGFADMQPLKKVVGDARIVALGEATHGTHEFFQLNHRMLEFLASEMGFTIFSIEANMPNAYQVNDYVLDGRGDPAQLSKIGFLHSEVLPMISWMREFNQSGKGRVEFTGFDMQGDGFAARIVERFVAASDVEYEKTVQAAPRNLGLAPSAFATYWGTFPVEDAAGKTVRFSGNIRTRDVTGYANLWWVADRGEKNHIAFKTLGNAAPKGTTDWQSYEVEIVVPPETTKILFGVRLDGGGTAWFDDLAVAIDGRPYTKAKGFELLQNKAALPKGKFAPSRGYEAAFETDESNARSGSVLQLTRTMPDIATAAKDGVAKWRMIIEHLQLSRDSYIAKGRAARNVDWAIQNARLVLQCMQMKAGQISRDRAMAENVKWILDHSPEAKIVLWAHNGHVQTDTRGGKAMGGELREMYGNQMVVFGYGFNQGSFQAFTYDPLRESTRQAIEQVRELHNITVPPMLAGSLDGTFAAAGIPLFALDMRHVPQGSVGTWFNEPHKARWIGATFNPNDPNTFDHDIVPRSTFDVMLFVEKTTAPIPTTKGRGF